MTNRDDIWQVFGKEEGLTEGQVALFEKYFALLQEGNEQIALTTIVEPVAVLRGHFQDSLRVAKFIPFERITMIADVGAGAGFPGLPLKIKFPHLQVVLIEVTEKKVAFLERVIAELGLEGVTVVSLDWRTFLRKTQYPIDLFISRAALAPSELVRMFRPSCGYNNARLVYWAAGLWVPEKTEAPYIQADFPYTLNHKKRRYIVFGRMA